MEFRFLDYWKLLWKEYLKSAVPWARDQIIWSAVMVVLPAVAVWSIHSSHIDWPLVRTTLYLYGATFAVYAAVHVLRAAWKSHSALKAITSVALLEKDQKNSALQAELDKKSKASIFAITDQDPQVLMEIRNQEFKDDLELHTPYNRPLIFDNRGKRDAMHLRVEMGKLHEGWAEWEEMQIIKHGEKQLVLPHIKGPDGQDIAPFQEFSLEMLLEAEWRHIMEGQNLAGCGPNVIVAPTLRIPIRITYQDHNENKFSTKQTMVYHYYKNDTRGYIEFTAPKFTRL